MPVDPPGASVGAKLLNPDGHSVVLTIGDRVRIDPESLKHGWRYANPDGVDSRNGVMWPLPDAPRIFFARCPGETGVLLNEDAIPLPTKRIWSSEGTSTHQAFIKIIVQSKGPAPSKCGQPFDPPRTRNFGVIDGRFIEKGVMLNVGESFDVRTNEGCKSHLHLPVPIDVVEGAHAANEILRYDGVSEQGRRYTAVARGELIMDLGRVFGCSMTDPLGRVLVEIR